MAVMKETRKHEARITNLEAMVLSLNKIVTLLVQTHSENSPHVNNLKLAMAGRVRPLELPSALLKEKQ